MTSNTNGNVRQRATEQLEGLGLSAYAARTFIALLSLEGGTAKEISEHADVPRTRVYDAADELEAYGLATTETSTPRRFQPVSIERAVLVLSTTYTERIDDVISNLETIGDIESTIRRDNLWLLTDQTAIEDRIERFIDGAEQTLFFATASTELPDAIADSLVDAADRSVSITAAGIPSQIEDDLAVVTDTVDHEQRPWDPSTLPVSTVVIADDENSLLTLDADGPLAFWSTDEPNNVLVLVEALLGE